jgi:hypothetical protein
LDFFENEMTSQNPGKVWVAEDPAGVWILFLFQKVIQQQKQSKAVKD